jgi:hypothetical protein
MLINGGVLNLRDFCTPASGSITITNATLTLDNTGYTDMPNRVADGASLFLNGGTLGFLGRAQSASTETLGNVQAVSGWNNIYATQGCTPVFNSAELTLGLVEERRFLRRG